jgi:squalene-hopene/tetraprenyl-beta-curcumene cyclase
MVILGLSQVDTSDQRYQSESIKRAIDWVLSMQCKNGGWASFDKDNNRMVFQYVPFADHNAMLDPPTVDITGRVLECLATCGFTLHDKAVKRAITVCSLPAGGGWLVVRPLGRELSLRNHVRAARLGRARLR